MSYIEYTFCDPIETHREFALQYKLRETSIAKRFYQLLKQEEADNKNPREPFRVIVPSPDLRHELQSICDSLNQQIEIVNSEHPNLIQDLATLEMSEEKTNRLHKHFEMLRGGVLTPSQYFISGTDRFRLALERLNTDIHVYESLRRGAGAERFQNHFFWTWENVKRIPLQEEDYQEFTAQLIFGTLFVNYCEVGKPLLDLFYDNDYDIVGSENIRPLRYYSADSFAWLGPDYDEKWEMDLLKKFYEWWDQNNIDRLGFKKGDPKNALGFIPVADLVIPNGFSPEGVIAQMRRHKLQKRMSLKS